MPHSFPTLPPEIEISLQQFQRASRPLRFLECHLKNKVLRELATRLRNQAEDLLNANKNDLDLLPVDSSAAFRDRLTLTPTRLENMKSSLQKIADLKDPVGEVIEQRTLENGVEVRRVRAPLGNLFLIFEARPNVILEAMALAFKSGNGICLRGGSDSKHTSAVIYNLIEKTFLHLGFKEIPVLGLQNYEHSLVHTLLQRPDYFDVVIPRGGDKLITMVQATATMPIIKNDRGLCHAYVDEFADLDMALNIVVNGKIQRPGVCNSLETILVHQQVASKFLPRLHTAMEAHGVRWYGDSFSLQILAGKSHLYSALEESWDTEYLDFAINCKIVPHLESAMEHIEKYGSKHSEVIITSNKETAQRFQDGVDAAAVYWNASTRFTDGFELGLGGEIGISTQKLHVRGPVGLRELTSPRWIIHGQGQIRN